MSEHSQLIRSNGLPQYGVFDHPVDEINVEDFDYHTPMDKPASRLAKHFHFKQFQFFGVLTDELIMGCAIAHLKYLSNAFVYLYDRQGRQFEDVSDDRTRRDPEPGWSARVCGGSLREMVILLAF